MPEDNAQINRQIRAAAGRPTEQESERTDVPDDLGPTSNDDLLSREKKEKLMNAMIRRATGRVP